MIVVTEVYEYVDDNMKRDENILTVDFFFPSNVSKEEAIEQLDKLVSLADDKKGYYWYAHAPSIFTKSPYLITDE